MADTIRSLASLQTLLADNTAGDISAQDLRDFLVSAYQPHLLTPGGRLTTETGVAVSTTDRASQGTLYYTPYKNNGISLFDGTSWKLYTFTEKSLSLTLTSGKNYDVFLYDNSGTLTLELSAAWTNDTTRADALALQDGVTVLSSDHTKRWLGTIRASGSNVTEDSGGYTGTTKVGAKRYVWNAYNQVARPMKVIDTTDAWTYGTNTWRAWDNSTGNRVEYVTGDVAQFVSCKFVGSVYFSTATTNQGASLGIGLDSTSAPSGFFQEAFKNNIGSTNYVFPLIAHYEGNPGLGYHYLQALENSLNATNVDFLGDDGGGCQSGLMAWLMG